MINLEEKEFEQLKEKEEIVDEIKKEKTIRDHLNFVMAHVMIGAGIIITVIGMI